MPARLGGGRWRQDRHGGRRRAGWRGRRHGRRRRGHGWGGRCRGGRRRRALGRGRDHHRRNHRAGCERRAGCRGWRRCGLQERDQDRRAAAGRCGGRRWSRGCGGRRLDGGDGARRRLAARDLQCDRAVGGQRRGGADQDVARLGADAGGSLRSPAGDGSAQHHGAAGVLQRLQQPLGHRRDAHLAQRHRGLGGGGCGGLGGRHDRGWDGAGHRTRRPPLSFRRAGAGRWRGRRPPPRRWGSGSAAAPGCGWRRAPWCRGG